VSNKKDRHQTLRFPTDRLRERQFYETSRQLERERNDAQRMVDRLLRQTPRDQWPGLIERTALHTCGAVERLAAIVTAKLERHPKYAEDAARLAVSLAEFIPADAYPAIIYAQARAYAWKELGKTLSFLARHDEAIAAFTAAEQYIADFGALEHDRAIIRLNLSITLQETGRYSEALAILGDCKMVFVNHADTRLCIVVGIAEGALLQRLQKYREARETYLLLLASAIAIDKESLGALHRAIGLCCIELGDFEEAEANLGKAVRFHHQIEQPLEIAKDEAGRGRLFVRRGAYRMGIEHLRPVRHQFLRYSLAEEAGLTGLDMVEGMLLAGHEEEAELLSRTIMSEFLAAGLNVRAVTARGHLAGEL
jgi:tetratricopeptide (TPR) repeat protein